MEDRDPALREQGLVRPAWRLPYSDVADLPPEAIEKGEDVQYVSKNNAILLDEMIREEILLHFEEFPVCSGGCKGLCHTCGANRNEKKCSCSTAALKPHSPFRFL